MAKQNFTAPGHRNSRVRITKAKGAVGKSTKTTVNPGLAAMRKHSG